MFDKCKWAQLSLGVCEHNSTDIRVRATNNRMDLALWMNCTSQRKPMTLLSPLLVSHTNAASKPNRKIVLSFYKSENFLQFVPHGSTASLASDFYSSWWCLPPLGPILHSLTTGTWEVRQFDLCCAIYLHALSKNDSELFFLPLSPPISSLLPPVLGISRSRNPRYSRGLWCSFLGVLVWFFYITYYSPW